MAVLDNLTADQASALDALAVDVQRKSKNALRLKAQLGLAEAQLAASTARLEAFSRSIGKAFVAPIELGDVKIVRDVATKQIVSLELATSSK